MTRPVCVRPGEPVSPADRLEESQVVPGKIWTTRGEPPIQAETGWSGADSSFVAFLPKRSRTLCRSPPTRQRGLPGQTGLLSDGARLWDRFVATPLPSEDDELWKYSDVGQLDLDSFSPLDFEGPKVEGREDLIARARRVASFAGDWSALVVTVDGALLCIEQGADAPGGPDQEGALRVHRASVDEVPEPVAVARDAFDDLHSAFAPDVVQVRIKAKAHVERPVVIVHLVTRGPGSSDDRNHGSSAGAGTGSELSPACFPHLYVHVGASAEASLVEVITGAAGLQTSFGDDTVRPISTGLIVPVTELDLADNSRLSYASLQVLPPGWRQIGVQSGRVGRDASLRTFSASLGATAGRVRSDAELSGQGGEAALVAGYLGTGAQLHDLRTIQDHVAPHTKSQLLCMGAVTDRARSAYVGLTRVRNGAHGADAFQTNRNLVLSEGAHADSVPTLDIQENDVRCSHASTVGPIDEDQRYYLESRGIDPAVAERLIVLGFFTDLASATPISSVGDWFVGSVSKRLAATSVAWTTPRQR